MSRARSKINHIIAIVELSVLVASATVPCSAWAKGGDQGNGNGGGNGSGHDNGNGNGEGAVMAAPRPSGSGAAPSGGPANVVSSAEALASNPMLGRAVVALKLSGVSICCSACPQATRRSAWSRRRTG